MLQLPNSLARWGKPDFDETFIQEVSALTLDQLPLQQAMTQGNAVVDANRTLMINARQADEDRISVRTGVFFSTIIAGCSCADDPTPIDLNTEYCELEFLIDRRNGDTSIHILA